MLVDRPYLSIGSLQLPLQNRLHVGYCKADCADLEALCVHFFRREDLRNTLVASSCCFFDTCLHRPQLAAKLHHCARLRM